MKKHISTLTGVVTAFALMAGPSATATDPSGSPTPSVEASSPSAATGTAITMTTGDITVTATLNDSDAAQDLVALLPLTVPGTKTGIEVIFEPTTPLTETGPFLTDLVAGDIVYWNPGDSVGIIFAQTGAISELTKLGEITSDLAAFEDLPAEVDLVIELASPTASGDPAVQPSMAAGTPTTITVGDFAATALLNDSDAARDFVATLPITVPAARVGSIEFMVELPAPLTETGPFYTDVEAGDVVYWNPRDSVTFIYRPTSSVSELTELGEITSDLDAWDNLPDDVEMVIEVAG